jgi:hypothetical protein
VSDEAEAIKADIEQARAELAGTADALAAKLDVKAQANRKVHDANARVVSAYEHAKTSAPEPVQRAWTAAEGAAHPVVVKAAQDKKRTALIAAGVLVAVLIVKRFAR